MPSIYDRSEAFVIGYITHKENPLITFSGVPLYIDLLDKYRASYDVVSLAIDYINFNGSIISGKWLSQGKDESWHCINGVGGLSNTLNYPELYDIVSPIELLRGPTYDS